ncbi:MAG TPA: hypothetical protein VHA06_18020 [Candidatus Angelobacter sp.]|nr:hypothetical protein [Candidatus Angelobacter sp.]
MGRNPNFLPRTKALGAAFMALVFGNIRNIFTEENFRMGNVHASQHIISALDENPAGCRRSIGGRINHFADESPIRREGRWNRKQNRKRQTQ